MANSKYNEKNEKIDKEKLSPYLRHAQKNREEESSFVRVLSLITIVFVGILLSIFILADNKKFLTDRFGPDSFITTLFNKLARGNGDKERDGFSLPFGLRRQNILFLGVDANNGGNDPFEGTRSDTIIILNIDPRTKSVNAVAVPRDSKVFLPGDRGVNKINAAHALGGIKLTKATIEDTLGIRIDKYIIVHDEAVRQIVDAIGGVDLYVEKNMRYNDYAGNLHVNLTKGDHHLDGTGAVGYLRFRHDATGDIGRTQRQQWFLRAVVEQLKKPDFITKLPEIVSVAKKYVKTDMSLSEMAQYAAIIKGLDMDKVEIATLPGGPNASGAVSYWILDLPKTQETINRLIYREKSAMEDNAPLVAGVMYSSDNELKAKALIASLKAQGVDVKCTGSASKTHSQFVAHTDRATNTYYNYLKKNIEDFPQIQFVFDPMNYYCRDTDFTIVLAGK